MSLWLANLDNCILSHGISLLRGNWRLDHRQDTPLSSHPITNFRDEVVPDNIYTLRGALVRDPLEWSKQINKALYHFGQEAEVMFASHSWPRWGNDRIQEVMRGQRDTYANLNNGVLHLANQGVTINEIHNVYEVPQSLLNEWFARSYHGSVQHNKGHDLRVRFGTSCNWASFPLACQDAWPESTIFGAACGKHYFRHGGMGNAAKTDRPSELEQASTPSFHH